jgi:hypothetical protein
MAGKGQYYGFKAQEDADVINWASIAKGLGDTLKEEAKRREDKKADIDKASEDLGDYIANSPLGGHEGAVASTADLADQAQNMRLMQDRMLKSGELSLRDYNTMRGNTEKDIKTLYSSASEFQKLYGEDLERSESGVAALQESWMNSNLEGFLNPSATKYRFDPNTGQLMLGALNSDGQIDQGSMRPVSAIQNEVRTRVDAMDVPAQVAAMRTSLPGKFKEVIMSGDIKAIEGVVDIPEFQGALNTAIESMLVNPTQTASVLTNYLGEYGIDDFTTDPKSADESKILMIPNPMNPSSGAMIPKLTDKQTEKAKKAIKDAFILNIGIKEEARKDPRDIRLSQAEINRADKKDKEAHYVGLVADVISGEVEDFAANTNMLINQYNRDIKKGDPKLDNVERTSTGFKITYELNDGSTRTEEMFTQGRNTEDVAAELTTYLTPIKDAASATKDFDFSSVLFNDAPAAAGRGEVVREVVSLSQDILISEEGKPMEALTLFKNTKNVDDMSVLTQKALAQNFQNKNIAVSPIDNWGYDAVQIEVDGVTTEIPFNDGGQEFMNELQDFIDKVRSGDVEGVGDAYKDETRYGNDRGGGARSNISSSAFDPNKY